MKWNKRKYIYQSQTFDVYEIYDKNKKPYLIGSTQLFDFINTKIIEDINYLDLLITDDNGGTLKLCELNNDIILFDERKETQTEEEFVKNVLEDIKCLDNFSIIDTYFQ